MSVKFEKNMEVSITTYLFLVYIVATLASKDKELHNLLNSNELNVIFGVNSYNEVPSYKITSPLSRYQRLVKRDVKDYAVLEHPQQLFYQIPGVEDNQIFDIDLFKTEEILAPSFAMISRSNIDSEMKIHDVQTKHCHYFGNVTSHPGSIVALSTCDGLKGIIMTPETRYMIYPLPRRILKRYKRSVSGDHVIFPLNEEKTIHCPVSEHFHNTDAQLLFPLNREKRQAKTNKSKTSRRLITPSRRSTLTDYHYRRAYNFKKNTKNKNKIVEVAFFIDKSLYDTLKKSDDPEDKGILDYILTTINGINLIYNQTSLGEYTVTFKLVRLELMKASTPDLPDDGEAEELLLKFREMQSKMNPAKFTKGHWDNAVLMTGYCYTANKANGERHRLQLGNKISYYTSGGWGINYARHDMYVHLDEQKEDSVTGYAHVAAMCNKATSCSVNEGKGFGSLFSIAHEIGHNFGMVHDGYGNDCAKRGFLMAADSAIVGTEWSSCSRETLSKLMGFYDCLDNVPVADLHSATNMKLAGQRYDADVQCQFYTKSSKSIRSRGKNFPVENICTTLWCNDPVEIQLRRAVHPALEGTHCGANNWCRGGKCVPWGKSTLSAMPKVINGQWGEFSENNKCTSECITDSKGFSIATRECNSPKPQNGGSYCTGVSSKVTLCDDSQICKKRTRPVVYAKKACKEWTTGATVRTKGLPNVCTFKCQLLIDRGLYRVTDKLFPDGKKCGSGQYCLEGKCIKPGEPSIDGGWSIPELVKNCGDSADDECLKDGVELKIYKRVCNNPKPSNGGNPCEGSETVTEICPITKKCKLANKTPDEYATAYCTKLTQFPYFKNLLTGSGKQLPFESYDVPNPQSRDVACITACQLSGTSDTRFTLIRNYFPDGTPCGGEKTPRHYCVDKKCMGFDCNGKLKADTRYEDCT